MIIRVHSIAWSYILCEGIKVNALFKFDMNKIELAQTVWNYMKREDELYKVDVILVLGSHDIRVAEYGAELYLKGFGDWLVMSGGLGNLTQGIWTTPEAEIFKDIAIQMGVPEKNILVENKSTNTGENIQFSHELLEKAHIEPKSIILVQKPYMLRRTYATFMKQWPGTDVKILVTAPSIGMLEYPNEATGGLDHVINIMLGDLKRIQIYPDKGFQIPQEIPQKVWTAYEKLCKIMGRDPEQLSHTMLKNNTQEN